MATNSNRDVRMTLAVATTGEQEIQDLQAKIQKLAKEGGDAAPEFAKLAAEIARIADQASALRAFEALSNETAQLAQRQELAAASAIDLRAKLDALSATTTAAAERQHAAATALEQARLKQQELKDSLAQLRIETDRAGKSDAEYLAKKKALELAALEQSKTVRTLAAALTSATTEVRTAETAENALAGAHNKAASAAAAAAAALQNNINAVRNAATAANELGVSTSNVATEQAEIIAALNAAGAAATRLQQDVDRLAARERELASIRVFEQQANDAAALLRAAEYARFWELELQKIETRERELLKIQMEAKWQREAEAIVNAAHAAQELARQAQILEAAERELAAQRAFEKAAQDAANLVRAGDYIRNYREQLEKAEKEAREAAEAASAASKKIASAFQTLGVKSAADLEAEIAKVRQAMRTVEQQAGTTGGQLRTAFDAGGARIAELQRQLRAVNGEITTSDRLAGLFANSIGQISAGNIIANGFGFLIQKLKDMAVAFVETIVQTQNLRRALTSVYQDSKIAASQFEFLKTTANAAGVSVGGIQQAFVKFSAATKASGLSLELTNNLFAAVTRSAGILGLSGEQVTGTLEALSQMASKGTVSMEELRQQLGDRLPGALSLVAKGLGLTESQLVKLVESGGLAAADLFPALTESLGKMSGEADGLSNSFQRFKNVLTETAQSTGDAVWLDVLTGALSALGYVLAPLLVAFSGFSTAIAIVAKSAGILVASIATLTNPLEALQAMFDTEAERMIKLNNAIGDNTEGRKKAAEATAVQTAKAQAAGEAAAQEAAATVTTSKALEAKAFAAKLAADSTVLQSSAIVQLKAYIDSMLSSQEKQIDADVKLAKAAKIQGDSLVELTKLRGKDFETMQAQVAASTQYSAALDKAAQSQKTETELLILKRDEIVKATLAQGQSLQTRKVELEAIEKKIIASKAETEQSVQAAAAANQEVAARRLAVEVYKDNAARVDEFRLAMESAQLEVAVMTEAEKNGFATKEQVAAATRREAETTALYNDAIKDSIAQIELLNRVQQAQSNLKLTAIELEVKHLEGMAAARKAVGDYAGALVYEVDARRKQIEAIKLSSEAKRLEAEATIKALEIERAALDQADPMLKAKQAEIDIRLANAKAKLLEANAGKEAIASIEREIDALKKAYYERTNNTQGTDLDTKSRRDNTKAIDEQTAALKRKQGAQYDEQNFALNTAGERVNATSKPSPTKIAGSGDWNYVDKNGQWRIAHVMPTQDSEGNWTDPSSAGRGVSGAQDGNNMPLTTNAGPAPTSGKAGVQTVNINLNGKTTAVNTASPEDAAALTGFLRQLENAAGTAK